MHFLLGAGAVATAAALGRVGGWGICWGASLGLGRSIDAVACASCGGDGGVDLGGGAVAGAGVVVGCNVCCGGEVCCDCDGDTPGKVSGSGTVGAGDGASGRRPGTIRKGNTWGFGTWSNFPSQLQK